MCLICIETAKGNVQPKDFWRAYRELIDTDHDHATEVIELISNQSIEFQEALAIEAMKESDDEDDFNSDDDKWDFDAYTD